MKQNLLSKKTITYSQLQIILDFFNKLNKSISLSTYISLNIKKLKAFLITHYNYDDIEFIIYYLTEFHRAIQKRKLIFFISIFKHLLENEIYYNIFELISFATTFKPYHKIKDNSKNKIISIIDFL